MNTRLQSKTLKVTDHFEDRGVDGGTICDECTGNDVRKSACGGLVVTAMKQAILQKARNSMIGWAIIRLINTLRTGDADLRF